MSSWQSASSKRLNVSFGQRASSKKLNVSSWQNASNEKINVCWQQKSASALQAQVLDEIKESNAERGKK